MPNKYSFLKDETALLEIKRHKWLESQKKGKEIGFATAALDWIKNHGNDWKDYHFKNNATDPSC